MFMVEKLGILFIGNIIDAKGDVDINRAKKWLCMKQNHICEVKLYLVNGKENENVKLVFVHMKTYVFIILNWHQKYAIIYQLQK